MSKKLLITCAVMMTLLFIMTRWQAGKIDGLNKSLTKLEKDNSSLTNQLSRQQAITENANRTFRIINNVSSINSEERNRSAVDSEKIKTVIKTVLVNNDCANTAIPNDALIRMHDYSERIRASGAHSDTGTPNR
ncbi:hypothetical protein ACA538_003984 [Proteus mirabilis]|uniref:hypothetical protein n=1 Tax=Proteus mirabilis TaxID=584 RepID=UPI0018C545E0|nr:hypothetical protein [Proteus mirabilis]EKT8415165.1 hypothetical protein [Proteus mirabilis]EKU7618848.1 hypothetical protein [Proteus mirabilis]ELT7780315.1 hypothetical protein [Proteus mirabilis]MBG2832223.1 hypothetical protein [Proteus mirabilis]HEK1867424.1 hypothetical protein [Proteus mirabilis]